jgi:hypothetical protein
MTTADLGVIVEVVPILCTFLLGTNDELGWRDLESFLR